MIALLFFAAMINYIDRGSLSVAAPVLSAQLSLSPTQMGFLLSAFFWSYAAFQTLAGWLTDRYPVTLVFAGGFFLWSAATFGTGLASTMAALFVLRLFLGAGESVGFPTFSKVIAAGFPIEKRGLPNSILDAGTKLGPAIGTLAGGLLLAKYGWRPMFFILGGASLLWLIPWLIWAPRPAVIRPAKSESVGLLDILRRREAWGTFVGNFCYMYAFFFLLTWLPTYLINERHVSVSRMAVLGSIPFWGSAVSAVLCGWGSDQWIKRGASPTLVRKTVVITGLLLSTVMVPSVMVSDVNVSIFLLSVAYVAFGMYASNHWAITQTLAGPIAAGKWTGLQNTIGALSGIIAPIATGFIVEKTGVYFLAFLSPAILAVIGASSYIFLIGPVAPIAWKSARKDLEQAAIWKKGTDYPVP